MNYAKMSRPFREIEYNEYYGVRSKEWIDIDWEVWSIGLNV